MNYRLPYTLKNNSSALVHSKFWWPFKALLSCFQHPQKLTNECTHGAVMSQPSVGFSQSSTLNQSPCSCWCVYAVFQAFSFTSHQFLAGFPNRLSSVISTTFVVVVFFKILLFKMQISNTCCSLTRTAHSWDIDTNNFRFSVDSIKQNFRFDYFFQFSHKKGSFFSRFIYSIYSYRLQPEWVHLAVDVKDQMKLISAGEESLQFAPWNVSIDFEASSLSLPL